MEIDLPSYLKDTSNLMNQLFNVGNIEGAVLLAKLDFGK